MQFKRIYQLQGRDEGKGMVPVKNSAASVSLRVWQGRFLNFPIRLSIMFHWPWVDWAVICNSWRYQEKQQQTNKTYLSRRLLYYVWSNQSSISLDSKKMYCFCLSGILKMMFLVLPTENFSRFFHPQSPQVQIIF